MVELWDWTTSAWELVSTSTPSGTDTTVVANPGLANDGRFVHEGDELVKARVRWYEINGTAFPWKVEINQATWTITRN